MGAWGTGSFDNDAALDFATELKDFPTLCSMLADLNEVQHEFDADEASVAIAACDLIAVAVGRSPSDVPDDLPDFKTEQVPDDLLANARTLVQRVRETSELAQLWQEEDDSEWQLKLDDLVLRLTPSAPYKAPKKKKRVALPKDTLGHCYVCFGLVTARDGLLFEYTPVDGGTCLTTPHRACIEEKIAGPHWNADGTPTARVAKVLRQDMGFEE